MKPSMKIFKAKYAKTAGPSPAAIAKKALLRKIQRQELRKLQAVIPSTSRPSPRKRLETEPDACDVIYSAIRYIDQLHATILARVRSGTLPPDVLDRMNLTHLLDSRTSTAPSPAQPTPSSPSDPSSRTLLLRPKNKHSWC